MPRDCRIYLEDILDSTRKIRAYTNGFSKTAFLQDNKTFDAGQCNAVLLRAVGPH
jgi:uncharacterized protein with HEPN domain